jgi:hypothetical protein
VEINTHIHISLNYVWPPQIEEKKKKNLPKLEKSQIYVNAN